MKRLPDWPERLAEWVTLVRDRPFRWGEWDCAICAADAVKAITETDQLNGLCWTDIHDAARQLEIEGGIEAAVTARLGEPISPKLAQRGDLVLMHNVDTPEKISRDLVAVCLGHVACAPASLGMVFPEMRFAVMAWKVGR